MTAAEGLASLLAADRTLRPVGDGVLSALPPDDRGAPYDRWAAAYDLVVGSHLYNRLVWSASPDDYRAFAQDAVSASLPGAWVLDAGCGSAVFTAEVYRRAAGPLVLVDRSLGMLERAARRLPAPSGQMPEHVVLLQADLYDLPFRPGSFATVLSMGLVHLFEDAPAFVRSLQGQLTPAGRLYVSSLVAETRRGTRALQALQRRGEAVVRTADELRCELDRQARAPVSFRRTGSMAYATIGP